MAMPTTQRVRQVDEWVVKRYLLLHSREIEIDGFHLFWKCEGDLEVMHLYIKRQWYSMDGKKVGEKMLRVKL